ncbi:MAG: hypothetical protein V3U49_00675, partial [Nitrososphaerales archaeon]
MSGSKSGNSVRSTSLQLGLFALAVLVSGAVVIAYPVPEPQEEDESPENFVFVEAFIVNEDVGGTSEESPAAGVDLTFFEWSPSGVTSKIAETARTNQSGVAMVKLESGTFDVQVADWTTETIEVFQNSTLSITRFLIEALPSGISVLALTGAWEIAPSDLVEATFTNEGERPVHLHAVTFNGVELFSFQCEVARQIAQNQNAEEAYLAIVAEDCDVEREIQPFQEWRDSFR